MTRLASLICCVVLEISLFGCVPEHGADLSGPRITHSSLSPRGAVELPVGTSFSFEFSEPLDALSVHAGSIALVAWEALEQRCSHTPFCAQGDCVRGRCQADPLSSAQRNALARGEFDATEVGAVALDFELVAGELGPHTALALRPRRLLAAHRRYSLVLGPGLRDASGAPLVDELERPLMWETQFVTAGEGSSGPEPRLRVPASGQLEVATNLARVELSVWPPVPSPDSSANVLLEALDGGEPARLEHPGPCRDTAALPGSCLSWQVVSQLRPHTRYRPAGGTLVDRLGRMAQRPALSRETWFATGAGPDRAAPEAEVGARLLAACLLLDVEVQEPVEASLRVGERVLHASLAGAGSLALELDAAMRELLEQRGELEWSVELSDLAGNEGVYAGSVASAPSFAPHLPELRLSEILANPAGAEPDAEFIEIVAGPAGAELAGVMLSELGPEQLYAAFGAGEAIDADALPPVLLGPGEVALIVGEGWSPAPALDGSPPASTQVLRVEGSLGEGGLKNVGEALSLWIMDPEQGPLVLHGYSNWIDTSASSFNGRSLISSGDRCDLASRWQPHPLGSSSPGVLP